MKTDVMIASALLLASIGMAGAIAINPDVLGENGKVGANYFPMTAIAYGPHWALPMNESTNQLIAGDMVWVTNPDPAPVKTGKGVIGSFRQVPIPTEKWNGWV